MKTGLGSLVDQWLKLSDYFGANAGLKVTALVAGMLAGADFIDDMSLLRHGAMRKLFTGTYEPSTLGSFLRAFSFGHVRQLDAAASRWLRNLSAVAPIVTGIDEYALLAIVSTGLSALIIIGSRLRKGPTNSARGAAKFVVDVVKAVKRLRSDTRPPGVCPCC